MAPLIATWKLDLGLFWKTSCWPKFCVRPCSVPGRSLFFVQHAILPKKALFGVYILFGFLQHCSTAMGGFLTCWDILCRTVAYISENMTICFHHVGHTAEINKRSSKSNNYFSDFDYLHTVTIILRVSALWTFVYHIFDLVYFTYMYIRSF